MLKYLICLLSLVVVVWSAKPMEALTNYNVILVHGAGDKWGGLDCAGDNDIIEPYDVTTKITKKNDKDSTAGMDTNNVTTRIGGLRKDGEKQASATGMLKDLPTWLRNDLFEHDTLSVYLQRPFVKPANSPFENGKEIGKKTWFGEDKCAARRSLIEEAQEVKAKGRVKLSELRENASDRDKLPPSRNILIAHSMGGVASREYVQGDFYNDDVDKVITLDSPHKGTYSLEGLLDIKNWYSIPILEASMQSLSWMGIWTVLTAMKKSPTMDWQSIIFIAELMGILNGANAITDAIVDFKLGYDYEKTDPLVSYIRPGSDALQKLNSKPYSDNLPMMRILSSEGGLTFGSNAEYRLLTASGKGGALFSLPVVVPDALYTPVQNIIAQTYHTEVPNPVYYNNILASTMLGLLGGFTLTDHGSVLIPHWSGSASDVLALNKADVRRETYMATDNSKNFGYGEHMVTTAIAVGSALVVLDVFGVFDEITKRAMRLAIVTAAAVGLAIHMTPPTVATIMDLKSTHEAPVKEEYQSIWKGIPNTYSKISDGNNATIEPYLMEDFLYEKPFVNLRITSANDTLENPSDNNLDFLGLLGPKPDTTYAKNPDGTIDSSSIKNIGTALASLAVVKPEVVRERKLSFINSPGDWDRLGVKKDRWVKVDGVDGEKTVPIRHVDRFAMPDIVVTEFIESYRFIIDDLMPHRLRQIRINFNFMEDIAWECDVNKVEGAEDACVFYRRSSDGNGWVAQESKPHPVKKDGTFDFKPDDYDI